MPAVGGLLERGPRERLAGPPGPVRVAADLPRLHLDDEDPAIRVTDDDIGLALADVPALARKPAHVMEERDIGREHGAQPVHDKALGLGPPGRVHCALGHGCPGLTIDWAVDG